MEEAISPHIGSLPAYSRSSPANGASPNQPGAAVGGSPSYTQPLATVGDAIYRIKQQGGACDGAQLYVESDWDSTNNRFNSFKRAGFHDPLNPSFDNRAYNFQGLMRTANPKYAGGHVMEMIVGPFDSICSGNQGYFDNGNSDFTHADTMYASGGDDPGMTIASPANAAAPDSNPPERLFCSHVHFKDSPYGYVAGGVQFTINGGAAF